LHYKDRDYTIEKVLHDEDQHFGEYIESVHPSYFVNQKFINPMYREHSETYTGWKAIAFTG
jgi:hypothetical protein